MAFLMIGNCCIDKFPIDFKFKKELKKFNRLTEKKCLYIFACNKTTCALKMRGGWCLECYEEAAPGHKDELEKKKACGYCFRFGRLKKKLCKECRRAGRGAKAVILSNGSESEEEEKEDGSREADEEEAPKETIKKNCESCTKEFKPPRVNIGKPCALNAIEMNRRPETTSSSPFH